MGRSGSTRADYGHIGSIEWLSGPSLLSHMLCHCFSMQLCELLPGSLHCIPAASSSSYSNNTTRRREEKSTRAKNKSGGKHETLCPVGRLGQAFPCTLTRPTQRPQLSPPPSSSAPYRRPSFRGEFLCRKNPPPPPVLPSGKLCRRNV